MTHEKLPKAAGIGHEISAREAWKLFGIMAEFFEATERLSGIRPAVSMFGSARVAAGSRYYRLAEDTARLLSDAGAFHGSGLAVGLNIDLPREQLANRFQHISLRFKHFFARKVMFAKFATAFVVMPGGYGTLDELFEALTLVQTGKTRQMPIILVHEPFWRGLLDWCRERLVEEGMIDATDVSLVQVCNEPQQVVDAIFAFYEKRSFEPSPAEREVLLNL